MLLLVFTPEEQTRCYSAIIPNNTKLEQMDPFFKAISSAIGIIVIFFIAIVGGHLLAAITVKDKTSRQAVTALLAIAIFLILFFSLRH